MDEYLSKRICLLFSDLFDFLGIITFINCVSVKWANIFQNIFSIGKVAGLLIIIAFGVYSMAMGKSLSQ